MTTAQAPEVWQQAPEIIGMQTVSAQVVPMPWKVPPAAPQPLGVVIRQLPDAVQQAPSSSTKVRQLAMEFRNAVICPMVELLKRFVHVILGFIVFDGQLQCCEPH